MLIGEYFHGIDPKGRVIFPAKFREEMGEGLIITQNPDYCLAVYTQAEWMKIADALNSLPRSKSAEIRRFFFAHASDVEIDKQGRVLIPTTLREYAGLTKEVAIIGTYDKVEIWDKERWSAKCSQMSPESIAQAMEDLGF